MKIDRYFTLLLAVAFTLPSCAAVQSATKSVDLPAGCVDAADLIVEAAPVIAKGGDELLEELAEVAKGHPDETIECARSLYVARKGGVDKLTDNERLAYDIVTAYLERKE